MKLQLDEKTLNAYINEAIKYELAENSADEALGKLGKAIGKAAKGTKKVISKAGKGTKNYFKALGGNKKSTKQGKNLLDALKKELDAVEKEQKAIFGTPGSGQRGHELATRRNTLVRRIRDVENGLNKASAGTKLARTSTTAAAGGLGAGYLLGRNNGGGKDPNAPWNDTTEPGNESVPGGDDNGGFDGGFPWDNTDPAWTPKSPKRTGPTADTTQEPAPVQPERPKIEPIAPVTTQLNMVTGVTGQAAPGIVRPEVQPRFPQNAVSTMINTAQESPAVASQREKNRALKQMRDNAVNAIKSDSYGADKAVKKADAKYVKDAYKTIKRGNQHPSL